jgi:cyclopropane-fatty-acyl-phospholipid synthase
VEEEVHKSIQSQKAAIFNSLFQLYEGPAFAIRLWDGWSWSSSNGAAPACALVVQSPQALQALIAAPNEITLGEAFIHGGLEIEGDIFSVFPVAEHLFNRPRPLRQKLRESSARTLFGVGQWLHHGAKHSPRRDHASIAYHYDQPVAFFEPWLGPSLAYSCAYFRNAEDPLDLAQQQKLELICRKLRLQPLERFLDIGCGWGSLVLHAARNYRAHAQGITLSKEQEQVARRRIEQTRLAPRCAVKLRDYREPDGIPHPFDKIASIGMFEHVGLRNLPQYFSTVRRLLRPGGVFLNHGITRAYSSPTPKASFIDRYVFPDGQLVTLSQVLQAAESEGLEVRDVENLREHYELTLRHWVKGMQQNSTTLLRHVSEETYRIWLLYMAGSAAAFRRGDIAVHQVLFNRPDHGGGQFPLTREDWYHAR